MEVIYYDVLKCKEKIKYSNSWCYAYQLQGLIEILRSYNMIIRIK